MRFFITLVMIVLILSFTEKKWVQSTQYAPSEITNDTLCEEVQKFVKYFESFGIKFPLVALAQATWETDYFRSKIHAENNNLFGMKYKPRRFAYKSKNGHAAYFSKEHSVKAYARWQKIMLAKRPDITTEEEYLDFLGNYRIPGCPNCRYAEDTSYVRKIKLRLTQLKTLK